MDLIPDMFVIMQELYINPKTACKSKNHEGFGVFLFLST